MNAPDFDSADAPVSAPLQLNLPYVSSPTARAAAAAAAAASPLCPPTPLAASEHLRDASLPNAVLLNVYDIMGGNTFLWSVGWGMHHVGVQVYGKEYQYGYCEHGKGIGKVAPRHSPPHIFREAYCLGQTELSEAAVTELIEAFSALDEWLGSNYHVVRHNCIDFAHALCAALLPPEVRVKQAQLAANVGLERQRMEEVVVKGVRYDVPVLIPPHVDRLSRHAARFLPSRALERLDAADLPLSSVSEPHHTQ